MSDEIQRVRVVTTTPGLTYEAVRYEEASDAVVILDEVAVLLHETVDYEVATMIVPLLRVERIEYTIGEDE